MNLRTGFAILVATLLCTTLQAELQAAGPQVSIVQAASAPALERLAAEELADYLKRIYGAEPKIAAAAAKGTATILVGSPETNPAVKALGDKWPKLTDQGHIVRSVDSEQGKLLVIGGGSPVATFWAVAEYAHKLGVRSLIGGDFDPVKPPPFSVEGFDILLEPRVKQRGITLLGTSPVSTVLWSLEEHQRLLKQLAKLKFNFVQFDLDSRQPFLDFKLGQTQKKSAVLITGGPLRVDGDAAGRSVFRGAKFFDNPDFAGKESYADRLAAGQKFLHGLIDSAHSVGIKAQAGLSINMVPQDFAKEFQPKVTVLSADAAEDAPVTVLLTPRAKEHEELVRTLIRSVVTTYPELDLVMLQAPFIGTDFQEVAKASWTRLHEEAGAKEPMSLDDFSGKTAEPRIVRHEISIADTLAPVLKDEALWKSPKGQRLAAGYALVIPECLAQFRRFLPEVSLQLCPTQHLDFPVTLPPQTPAVLTIEATKGEILPLTEYASIPETITRLEKAGWQGYRLSGELSTDSDPLLYLTSRSSFDAAMTPVRLYDDLVPPINGEGVSERVAKAMTFVEQARRKQPENGVAFRDSWPIFLDACSLANLKVAEPLPQSLVEARDLYLNAMNEMYRANTRARDGNETFTLYHARRMEFAYEYINMLEAIRKAATAKAKQDKDEELAQTQQAVESLNTALAALGAIARIPSDRGLIAALNVRLYRPLKEELERLESAAN